MVRAGEPGGFSGFRPVLATQKQPTRISPFVLDGAADPRHVVRDHTCRWVRQLPGAVLLRNIWERRSEMALLRALGFAPAALGWMVFVENAALVVGGLVLGCMSAAVAIAPHVAADPSSLPWGSLSLTLAAVLAVGMAVGAAALLTTLRTSLLPALRSE